MGSSSEEMVLKSTDGAEFHIKKAVAVQYSPTIKQMIEDDFESILVPNVTGPILEKVLQYCHRHLQPSPDHFKSFDDDFLKVDKPTLDALTEAATYLEIQGLLELLGRAAD